MSTIAPLILVFAIPLGAAAILAAIADYRISSRLNSIASLLTLIAALLLFVIPRHADNYLLLVDLNIVFIVLNSFVGFTTSVFSASYIAHEIEIGRLNLAYLRLYHVTYEFILFELDFTV